MAPVVSIVSSHGLALVHVIETNLIRGLLVKHGIIEFSGGILDVLFNSRKELLQ